MLGLYSLIISAALMWCLLVTSSAEGSGDGSLRFKAIDLGTIGSGDSFAVAINNRGVVLGRVTTDDVNSAIGVSQRMFLWDGGKMQDLGTEFVGAGLNDGGEVVGLTSPMDFNPFDPLSTPYHPVFWSKGRLQDLLPPGYTCGSATGISNTGRILGILMTIDRSASPPFGKAYGFIMEGDGLHLLPVPPEYTQGLPNAMNEIGQIAGYLQVFDPKAGGQPQQHAALWGKEGSVLLSSLPGSDQSQAVAVNSHGEVLCRAFFGLNDLADRVMGRPKTKTVAFSQRGFLWDKGQVIDLTRSVSGHAAGIDLAKGNIPRALNDQDQVVGGATDVNGAHTAFLWQNGIMTDLNRLLPADSGWRLDDAVGINNLGQIVGNGKHNRLTHAFLLTPFLAHD